MKRWKILWQMHKHIHYTAFRSYKYSNFDECNFTKIKYDEQLLKWKDWSEHFVRWPDILHQILISSSGE